MAGDEIIRLPIDKQRKCPPTATAATAEPGANYAVMIALLLWTSQATIPVKSLHLPHPPRDLCSSLFAFLLSLFVFSLLCPFLSLSISSLCELKVGAPHYSLELFCFFISNLLL